MSVNASALTTLANLKEAVGIASGDTSQNAYLEKVINRTSAWIEKQTGRKLKARHYNGGDSTHETTSVSDEDYIYFSGATKDRGGDTIIDERGYGVFWLPQWPVQANSVLAFALDPLESRSNDSGETWDEDELDEFDDFIVERDSGKLILLTGPFTEGHRNYRVTMAAGYQESAAPYVPEELELLCIELAKTVYKEDGDVRSEKIGSWSRTFAKSKMESEFISDTIDSYSRTLL